MARIEMTGNIGSLLSFYKHERNIFGRCPRCNAPFRLSEVKLTYGKEPPRDMLTRLKRERDQLDERVQELDAKIQELEELHSSDLEQLNETHEDDLEIVDARWDDRFENEVDKRVRKRERQIRVDAITKSRAGQLGKTLEKIVPMFPGFGHHPYDVRPIFDPIDFVVFDGYYQGAVTDIVFVEFKTGQSRLNPMQGSIKAAVKGKRIHFEEKRLKKDDLRKLTDGKPFLLHSKNANAE
jgi:predicted Holliday junction resolvase-like endonuclease